jgi:octanoyl-[GcvH]:protein N-octanoyltransferase
MRIYRGRTATPETDRGRTRTMAKRTAETGERALRVWTPHRQIAFGRRDRREPGYERARTAAQDDGFPAIERRVGGRAVAYTGSTVAFARAEAIDDMGIGMTARYEAATTDLREALDELRVRTRPGEPPNAFCPGRHSLCVDGNAAAGSHASGGKVAGIAQRVSQGVALVAGVLVVDSAAEIAGVLQPVYRALDVPFDPESVGSIERTGGATDFRTVRGALERTFAGGESTTVERIEN